MGMAGGRPRATALCGAGHGGFQERRGVEGSVVREMPVWLCLSVCSPGRACGRSGRGRRRVVAAGGGRARGAWASDRRAEWLASAAAQRTAAPLVRPWTAAGGGGRRRTRARGVGVRPACRVVGVGGRPAHCGTVGSWELGGWVGCVSRLLHCKSWPNTTVNVLNLNGQVGIYPQGSPNDPRMMISIPNK
jgi:hypothetical protein